MTLLWTGVRGVRVGKMRRLTVCASVLEAGDDVGAAGLKTYCLAWWGTRIYRECSVEWQISRHDRPRSAFTAVVRSAGGVNERLTPAKIFRSMHPDRSSLQTATTEPRQR